ncbi:hypothetical protein J3D55_004354 [Chryseobacterium ginsenosidimutans]|uniref:DUF4401 domain-containing protein n=1 Tax=Chryseobacterium ginsenosidimutans TaxID=687846 RepID=UPI0021675212|nr:DUF4401 domain-containing protein [Chryseobacterium ginsenosidimutans]MCS3871438.1 hypothetical protein [Chryseobacterium ginsenosidimutans]
MRNKEDIKQILDHLQSTENRDLKFDEEAIFAAYEKNDDHQSLAIKILSIFGGIFASITFLGFLLIAGLYDSETGLIVFGIISIIGGVFVNKLYNKTIIDTVSISFYIIGFILLAMGLFKMEITENSVSLTFMLIAMVSLIIARSYILTFVSILIISGAILALIASNDKFDLAHIYTSSLAIILTFFFLKEAKIISINSAFSKLYNPIRIALVFSFLAGLIILNQTDFITVSHDYIWISSIFIILAILYLLTHLFQVLNITKAQHKVGIYALSIIILLPTVLSPAISGAILIILLSFLVNYKTSLVIGIAAFIYFISRYYYDLHFTLLTKSILLFSSGILFLGLYLLTHKKLTSNEKV